MSNLSHSISELTVRVQDAWRKLALGDLEQKLADLQEQSQMADFWSDSTKAQAVMQEIANAQTKLKPWQDLKTEVTDLAALDAMNDAGMVAEIEEQYADLQTRYEQLEKELAFSGPFDDHDALVSIYAGAGGTDAQDWAGMLLRMYTRWAESSGCKATLLEQSAGDEAGIKSATLQISGVNVYGKLKGEHGVHRLVRLSPYNADNLRQTSFAKVDVLPKISRPDELELDEKDLKIDVYRSGGHGGQSVNTTDSAVRVTHLPTGITVSIQNERSQLQNKETALTILRSRLAQLQLEQHKDRLSEIKGPNMSAEWGSQIRNYVLHPYRQVKDVRTKYESSDPQSILDGNLDDVIESYSRYNMASQA